MNTTDPWDGVQTPSMGEGAGRTNALLRALEKVGQFVKNIFWGLGGGPL